MHLSVTNACNSYMDFCDGIDENILVKNNSEIVNATPLMEDLEIIRQNQYVDDILERSVRSFKPYRNGEALSLQITTILDELLFESGYDRQIRPQIEGPPLEVKYRLDLLCMNLESLRFIVIFCILMNHD